MTQLADDLAYVRTIAEEGRQAPLIGGGSLVLWGLLTAAAWSTQWALMDGRIVAHPTWHYLALWTAFGLAGGFGSRAFRSRQRTAPGRTSVANQVHRAVWASAAWALLAVVAGAFGHAIMASDFRAPDVIAPVAFAIYGLVLMTTAGLAKEKWLGAFAFASFMFSAILGVFLSNTWFYLVGAAGVLAVLVIPGVILMLREPSTTV